MNTETKEKFRFRLSGKTLVIIDWANVYRWKDVLRWEVDPKKLFVYLSSYKEIDSKLFYCSNGALNKLSADFRDVGYDIKSKEGKLVPVSLDKAHFRKIIQELFSVLDGIKITNSNIATRLYDLRRKIENRLADREPDFDSDGNVQGEYPPYNKKDQSVYDSAYELIEELDVELKKLNTSISDLQKHLSEPVMRPKCDFDVEIARDVFNLSNNFTDLIIFSGDGDFSALAEDLILKGKKVIVVFASGRKGKEYESLKRGLFLCPVSQLKAEISPENNIPPDFSEGRDKDNISDLDIKSQESICG